MHTNVHLLALVALLLLPLVVVAQVPRQAHPIPLDSDADLFQCLDGDTVGLEKGQQGNVMRWSVSYDKKQLRACTKDLSVGSLAGMTVMRFRCRADTAHQLWVQLNEQSGERFYQIIRIPKEWKQIDLSLKDFKLNDDKVVNRRLDLDKVSRIVLLDFAALGDNAPRTRTVWLGDFKFSSNQTTRKQTKPEFAKVLKTGKVGMTCVPRDFRETEDQWLDFFTKANGSGVQLLSLQADFWSKTETAPGVYDFKTWDNFFAILDKHGFQFELSKDIGGPFFREKLDLPKDMQFRSFTDSALLSRYGRFLIAYLDRFGKRHHYVVIHAEGADAYFKAHPDQVQDYCRFLSAVRTLIQKHSPHIKVGVNTEPTNTDDLLRSFAEVTDFVSYDVLQGQIKKPENFGELVGRLSRISKDKKIAFQNVGWSTSGTDNSSEQQQAEFIREFYAALDRHKDEIEYASFGALYDHDVAITGPAYRAIFPDLPTRFVDKIVDSMSHCGMIRSDGTAKAGWSEFREQVSQYYQRQK